MSSIAIAEQLVRTQRFTRGVPDQFAVALDGAVVLFLRSRAGDDPVNCLWALDVDSGDERLLADPADLMRDFGPSRPSERAARPRRRVGQDVGIEGYATDDAAGLGRLRPCRWVVDGGRRSRPAPAPARDGAGRRSASRPIR